MHPDGAMKNPSEAEILRSQAVAPPGAYLPEETLRRVLGETLDGSLRGRSVLVLIPDHTRSLPLPEIFRALVETLREARQVDFLVALGTHPPLDEDHLYRLVGITAEERRTVFRHVGLRNHRWEDPASLAKIGVIPEDEVRAIAGPCWHPSLAGDVEVVINRAALEYDRVIIVAPTFPHEVAGFSGGAKYLVPGISGPAMIHKTHWLGALAGVVATEGIKETSVRAMIHTAAAMMPTPLTLFALVVENRRLAGIFTGGYRAAWNAAVDLSAQRHIRWCGRSYRRVLSCAEPMYDELWTAAKAVYKLEPVVEPGGEIILFAPHLDTISLSHGEGIRKAGYHILPYFLENWERFKDAPLAVLAHSTHVRGSGRMENGVERPDIRVTLATKIPPEECARVNLGYMDPATVRVEEWRDREAEGILYVPNAGEILYRPKTEMPG
jgi:nickel-dependent lactate racemase